MQRHTKRTSAWFLFLLMSAVLGSACGLIGSDEVDAITKRRQEIEAKKKKKVKKKKTETVEPVSEEDLNFTYNALDRRDPFKTYFDELVIEENFSNRTELQRFEIDKLKLIAVVVGTATPMAMIEDPSGIGHTVRIGTMIGKRQGQVKHIRRRQVVIVEEFRDFTGKRIPVPKVMQLEEEK